MMRKMLLVIYLFLCCQILMAQTINTLTQLPDALKETSGIAHSPIKDHYWSHNNKFVNGDPFVLGHLHLFHDNNGSIVKTVKINPNDLIDLSDMEDMTQDDGDIDSACTNKVLKLKKTTNKYDSLFYY